MPVTRADYAVTTAATCPGVGWERRARFEGMPELGEQWFWRKRIDWELHDALKAAMVSAANNVDRELVIRHLLAELGEPGAILGPSPAGR